MTRPPYRDNHYTKETCRQEEFKPFHLLERFAIVRETTARAPLETYISAGLALYNSFTI